MKTRCPYITNDAAAGAGSQPLHGSGPSAPGAFRQAPGHQFAHRVGPRRQAWGLSATLQLAPVLALVLAAALSGCGAPRAPASTSTPGPAATAVSVPALSTIAPQAISTRPQPAAAATAHPLATRAALHMLAQGGTALDATIAAQLVLGLVEPQSSGLGGGALLLVWDANHRQLHGYDGLAAAPARATAALRVDVDGRLLPAQDVAPGACPTPCTSRKRVG